VKPLGTSPIWAERFDELMLRWFGRQDSEVTEDAGSALAATDRIKRRVTTVQNYSKLLPAERQISSPREFETRWEASKAWKLLETHADRLGFQVIRERSAGTMHDLSQTVLSVSEREQIIIVDHALQQQIDLAVASGCSLPLKTDDLAPVALAREVYTLLVERMGRPPKSWVDEVAQHLFAQTVLGFPFSSLIFELLESPASASG